MAAEDGVKASSSSSKSKLSSSRGAKATSNILSQCDSLTDHHTSQEIASARSLRVSAPEFYPQGLYFEASTQQLVASLIEQKAGLNFVLTPPQCIRQEIVRQLEASNVPLAHYLSHENKGWINYFDDASQSLSNQGSVSAAMHSCPLSIIQEARFCDLHKTDKLFCVF